jgi:chromosomal replication initiator protein
MATDPIWQKTLDKLEDSLNPQHFATWIKPIEFVNAESDTVELQVPNRFFLDWIRENYFQLIRETLSSIGSVEYNIEFSISTTTEETHNSLPSEEKSVPVKPVTTSLPRNQTFNINPKYTFDEFVTGSSNQFAYAAAMAVANNPATTYNPLFVYGGVGLGKTHLVNAIGNEILKNDPQMSICYYTSEKFMNELINSLQQNG